MTSESAATSQSDPALVDTRSAEHLIHEPLPLSRHNAELYNSRSQSRQSHNQDDQQAHNGSSSTHSGSAQHSATSSRRSSQNSSADDEKSSHQQQQLTQRLTKAATLTSSIQSVNSSNASDTADSRSSSMSQRCSSDAVSDSAVQLPPTAHAARHSTVPLHAATSTASTASSTQHSLQLPPLSGRRSVTASTTTGSPLTCYSASHSPMASAASPMSNTSSARDTSSSSSAGASTSASRHAATHQRQFVAFTRFIRCNYLQLLHERHQFVRCASIVALIGLCALLYAWCSDTCNIGTNSTDSNNDNSECELPRGAFAIFGLCLLWLLLCIATRLVHERMHGPEQWLRGVNRSLAIYNYRFDTQQLMIVDLPPEAKSAALKSCSVNRSSRSSSAGGEKRHATLTSQHVFDDFENEMRSAAEQSSAKRASKSVTASGSQHRRGSNSGSTSTVAAASPAMPDASFASVSSSSLKDPAAQNLAVPEVTGSATSAPAIPLHAVNAPKDFG